MAPIVAPLQGHFDGGEVSPLLYGRVDSDRYRSSLALCKNWIPTLQGGLLRRSGTSFINSVKNSANKTRLVPFEFSTTQAYILEFGFDSGAGYIRFYANYGQIQVASVAYEIPTPYLQADLFDLRFTQSADVLYIVHPKYPPMKLQRFSPTSWQLIKIAFQDGPYLLPFDVGTLYSASIGATSGTQQLAIGSFLNVTNAVDNGSGLIRLTIDDTGSLESGQQVEIQLVGGTTEANGKWNINVIDQTHIDLIGSAFVHTFTSPGAVYPVVFSNNDVGRLIRMETSGHWGWGIVVSIQSPTTATIAIQGTLSATTVTAFALGLWSQDNGYPSTVCFHEDRLALSGTPVAPQRIDASKTSDYETFSPTEVDGTVQADDALDFSLNANDVNLNAWLNSDEKGLLAGSVSSEWVMRPSSVSEALTPTNVSAKRSSKWGSQNVSPVQVGKSTIYVQRGSKKIREFMYYFDIDGYRSTDLTELAEHITGTGVTELAYQSLPISVVWAVRDDGALIGMTYDRDMSQLRVGWHWHVIGGTSDASGTPAIVESIAVIPNPNGTWDDLWMIVQRYVDGQVVRHIEYMTRIFQSFDLQKDAFFVDAGLTYDSPLSITGISLANPAVVTAPAHGLSTGNQIQIDDVKGLFLNGISQVNGQRFTITVVDANTFQLQSTDTSLATGYVSGGEARKLVTTLSGLSYLEGETVSILADGTPQATQVVSSGQITLAVPSAVISIGYGYQSDAQLLRLEAGSRDGTSLGKTRRIHRVAAMLHRSQGLSFGPNFSSLSQFQIPDVNPTALFEGIISENCDFDYNFENQICLRADQPLPCMILAIMPQMETQDRG